MPKFLTGLLSIFIFMTISGCQTTKTAASGIKTGSCGVGKSLAGGAYTVIKSIDELDKWFRENWW